jgi:hypothetical protein
VARHFCLFLQIRSSVGSLDILAISKDKKWLLVMELKKGRASDAVVGQTLRYMNFVQEELAEEEQRVEGLIIVLEDDQKIRRALAMAPSVRSEVGNDRPIETKAATIVQFLQGLLREFVGHLRGRDLGSLAPCHDSFHELA